MQRVNVGHKNLADYASIVRRSHADEWDVIVVHDPQPVSMRTMVEASRPRWVWRCHIDLSEPNAEVLDFLLPSIASYDATIFHMHEYVPSAPAMDGAVIWPPA